MKTKSLNDYIQIRCSMLTNYSDCARRAVCSIIPNEIKEAGYELNCIPKNIGAAVGTAIHSGAEFILSQKLNGNVTTSILNMKDVEEIANSKFDEITGKGVEWDDTTPNRNEAQKQILSMLRTHVKHIAPKITPIALEKTFRLEIDEDFMLKGTIDVLEQGRIRDLKTGRIAKNNIFQYGGYKLLAEYNGHPISEINEDFVPRKEKPKAETISISPVRAEIETRWLIKRITSDIKKFKESSDKCPCVFSANPHTPLCSKRFCVAWGTRWCLAHQQS